MQSYLPDINTKYITYARVVLSSITSKKWASCFGALNSENALLPKEFQVEVSTAKYNEKTKTNIVIICNNCSIESNYHTIKIFDLVIPLVIQAFTQGSTQKAWVCPECIQTNLLIHSKIIKSKLAEPYFLQVVPNPPERKDGLLDRNTYNRKAEQWAWNFQNELDYQMSRFREANWNKESDDVMEPVDTHLEESMV